MRLTVSLKLQPTEAQGQALLAMLKTANGAANEISRQAWQHRTFGQYKLHKLCYHSVRQSSDLSAQVFAQTFQASPVSQLVYEIAVT